MKEKSMKKCIIFAILFAFLCSVPSVFAAGIQKVRIGTEGAYPPFNYVDKDGNLGGFDIDIAKALCKAAGLKCEFVIQDWDGIIPGLIAKKYDCIVASMSITDDRKKKVDFTKKYYQTPVRCVANVDNELKYFLDGIKDKTVGVQRGVVAANLVRAKFGDKTNVKAYATQDEANMDLVSGRSDLVCADSVILQTGFLDKKEGNGFKFIGPSFNDEKYLGEGIGIAVRKGDDNLRKLLNDAIDTIRKNGVYKQINNKYFDFDVYGE